MGARTPTQRRSYSPGGPSPPPRLLRLRPRSCRFRTTAPPHSPLHLAHVLSPPLPLTTADTPAPTSSATPARCVTAPLAIVLVIKASVSPASFVALAIQFAVLRFAVFNYPPPPRLSRSPPARGTSPLHRPAPMQPAVPPVVGQSPRSSQPRPCLASTDAAVLHAPQRLLHPLCGTRVGVITGIRLTTRIGLVATHLHRPPPHVTRLCVHTHFRLRGDAA